MLSENSSRPTLLKGGPREKWVTGSARRARQEEAVRHSQTQRSSTLYQVRTRFEDHASLQSNSGGSNDEDSDYKGSVGQPVDQTIVQEHVGKFTRAGPSTADASDHTEDSQVDDAAPWDRRHQQSAETD